MEQAKKTALDVIRERVEEWETGLDSLQQQLAEAAASKVDPKLLVAVTRQSLSDARKQGFEEMRQALKELANTPL